MKKIICREFKRYLFLEGVSKMFLGMLVAFLGNCGYQVHKGHRQSREVQRKIAEQKAKGIGGMCLVDKDGKIKRIYG